VPKLLELVADSNLAMGWQLEGELHDLFFDRWIDTILEDRLLLGDFLEGCFATLFLQFLGAIEAVS